MAELAQPFRAARYIALAEHSLARLLPHLPDGEKHRTGGFISLGDQVGQVRLLAQIGPVSIDKLAAFSRNANEKVLRTALTDSALSRDTLDEKRERYAGGVAAKDFSAYGGFSGLPQNFDEILVIDVFVATNDLDPEDAVRLLRTNPDFVRLQHLFDWAK